LIVLNRKSNASKIPMLAGSGMSQNALLTHRSKNPSVLTMPNLKIMHSKKHRRRSLGVIEDNSKASISNVGPKNEEGIFNYTQPASIPSEFKSLNLVSKQSLEKINSMTKNYKNNRNIKICE
jgi:hypothetical protein